MKKYRSRTRKKMFRIIIWKGMLEEFLISEDSISRPNYLVLSGRDSWGRNVVKRGRRFHNRKKR